MISITDKELQKLESCGALWPTASRKDTAVELQLEKKEVQVAVR